VDDLGGLGTEFGASNGAGLNAKGGAFQGDGYVGTYGGGGASLGSPVGATGQVTNTWTPAKVNIKNVIDKILGRDGDEEPPEPPTEPSPGIDYGADLSGHRNIPC